MRKYIYLVFSCFPISLAVCRMKGCVIGAGPSGLYVSKYLSNNGIPVTIYEKSCVPLGNYAYAISKTANFNEILERANVELKLGKDHTVVDDSQCDIYVVATGGLPRSLDIKGKELFIPATKLIKNIQNMQIGKRVLIYGLGNVTLDLLWHIYGKCRDVTILSQRSVENIAFDTHSLRKLLEEKAWKIYSEEVPKLKTGRRSTRRAELLQNNITSLEKYKVNENDEDVVKLLFNKEIIEANKREDKIEVLFKDTSGVHKEVFDTAVSSVGFIPNKIEIKTSKPVYYSGWCVNPKGNIGDAQANAKRCVEDILSKIKEQNIDKLNS